MFWGPLCTFQAKNLGDCHVVRLCVSYSCDCVVKLRASLYKFFSLKTTVFFSFVFPVSFQRLFCGSVFLLSRLLSSPVSLFYSFLSWFLVLSLFLFWFWVLSVLLFVCFCLLWVSVCLIVGLGVEFVECWFFLVLFVRNFYS